jgi:hypothetical protein
MHTQEGLKYKAEVCSLSEQLRFPRARFKDFQRKKKMDAIRLTIFNLLTLGLKLFT